MKEWFYQVFIGLDQWVNTWLCGSADETISSRCYRLNHIPAYRVAEAFVNLIFLPFQGPGHCQMAYVKEVRGRHVPAKFYDLAMQMNIEFDREKLGQSIEVTK